MSMTGSPIENTEVDFTTNNCINLPPVTANLFALPTFIVIPCRQSYSAIFSIWHIFHETDRLRCVTFLICWAILISKLI